MTQTEQSKKKTPDFNCMVSMKTGKPKNQQTEELFRKVFICGEEDLPKEPGIYAAFKDEKGLCWLNYPKTSWFGVKWYLLPIDPVPPKRLSDDEIRNLADATTQKKIVLSL